MKKQFNNPKKTGNFPNRGKRDADSASKDTRGTSKNKWNNDPRWHILNPETLKDLGKINLLYPLGQKVYFDRNPSSEQSYQFPGLLSMNWIPTPGISTSGSSGINLAANQLYSTIRHEFSGSSSYVAPDLFMYIYAMASIHIFYRQLLRAYGVLSSFSALNRYKPKAYFAAMNLDWDSFASDPAGFKSWLDVMVSAINQRCVPKTIDVVNYYCRMTEKIYKDHDGVKAQEFMYNPALVWKYEGYTDRAGGKLVPIWLQPHHNVGVSPKTLDQCKAILTDMISAVITDEDTGIMMSDMLKAFGAENMLAAPIISNDYRTPIEYDYNEVMSLHNATITGFTTLVDPEITQNSEEGATEGGKIIFNAAFVSGTLSLNSNSPMLFDTDKLAPTEEDFVEWLRFHNGMGTVHRGTVSWIPAANVYINTLSEILSVVVTNATVIEYNQSSDTFTKYGLSSSFLNFSQPSPELITAIKLTQFDWAPITYVMQFEDGYGGSVVAINGDIDQYGLVNDTYLSAYKLSSNLAELNVRA